MYNLFPYILLFSSTATSKLSLGIKTEIQKLFFDIMKTLLTFHSNFPNLFKVQAISAYLTHCSCKILTMKLQLVQAKAYLIFLGFFSPNSKSGNLNISFNSYCVKRRNPCFRSTVRISHTHTGQCQNCVDSEEKILCLSCTSDHLNDSLG